MKWLRNLLRKPPSTPGAPAPAARQDTRQPAAPPPDPGQLRAALAAAENPEERRGSEQALGRALAQCGVAPFPGDPPGVQAEAISRIADKSMALEWLAALSDEAALAVVATGGRYAEIRLAAARRISDCAVLERVAEATRDKDKGVYRLCVDALRQRREAAERALRLEALAAALRALLDTHPLPASRLPDVEKELRALGAGSEEARTCSELLEQARARVQDEARTQRELQSRLGEAEALRESVAADLWPVVEHMGEWHNRLRALSDYRDALPARIGNQPAADALEQYLVEIEDRLAEHSRDVELAEECERFLDCLPHDGLLDGEIEADWQTLPKPVGAAARAALEARWHALKAFREALKVRRAALSAPIAAAPTLGAQPPVEAAARSKRRIDHDAVRQLIDQLDSSLGEGHLAEADAAVRKIDEILAGASLSGGLAARLAQARSQLARLRGWARWGTNQAREHLIEAAQQLLAADPDVDQRAHAVPAMRAEWKRLDVHGPAAKEQWERFDSILEKAYQPVLARRAEEAAQQKAAKTAKEAHLADWEGWLAGIAWEHADYKVVEARRQEILAAWRAALRAGFRDERQLRKRFEALLAVVDARLGEARVAETERREQLIAAVESLAAAPDIGRAVAETKALQQRWQTEAGTVRMHRPDEQRLWQRFRAGCDAMFARREAQRAEQSAQRQDRIKARQELLTQLESATEASDPAEVERGLNQFRSAWAAAEPAPREAAETLGSRARELQERALRRIDSLRREKHQARFLLLARKSTLVEQLEAAAIAGSSETQAAEIRRAWGELPRLPGKTERALELRLDAAPTATETSLAEGRRLRDSLLLDLEIALEISSPESLAEARRARQLERLQRGFGSGQDGIQDAEALIVRWYATAATADEAQANRMEAILGRLSEWEAGGSRKGRQPR